MQEGKTKCNLSHDSYCHYYYHDGRVYYSCKATVSKNVTNKQETKGSNLCWQHQRITRFRGESKEM